MSGNFNKKANFGCVSLLKHQLCTSLAGSRVWKQNQTVVLWKKRNDWTNFQTPFRKFPASQVDDSQPRICTGRFTVWLTSLVISLSLSSSSSDAYILSIHRNAPWHGVTEYDTHPVPQCYTSQSYRLLTLAYCFRCPVVVNHMCLACVCNYLRGATAICRWSSIVARSPGPTALHSVASAIGHALIDVARLAFPTTIVHLVCLFINHAPQHRWWHLSIRHRTQKA